MDPFSILRRGPKYVPPWELKPLPGETPEELQHRQNEQYFREQVEDNVQWWDRVGYQCDFRGAKVLDLGCGHGALSISIAQARAAEVLGLDLDANRIDFAREVLRDRYSEIQNRVSFALEDVRKLRSFGQYDFVISKDSFEHIEDLDTVIASISTLLKPGGKVVVGFSPLYYSPFGDHGRLGLPAAFGCTLCCRKPCS
jgi:2-polyprenyl-3-methyl-5-hydroxy-6-metoxy-1,4-benzoquinol methylase